MAKVKLPQVGMIYLPDNPTSIYYKNIVMQSWINAGFNVELHAGITPKTISSAKIKLNFGIKAAGRNVGKDFTDTEKAVWHSHVQMWEIAARKENPFIIIEHDVMLLKPIEQYHINGQNIIGLCHNGLLSKKPEKGYRVSAGGAYLLKNKVAKKMIENLPKEIVTNSDAYIHNYIARYGVFKHEYTTQLYLPNVGTTIAHD